MSSDSVLGPGLGDDANAPDPSGVQDGLAAYRLAIDNANEKADRAQAAVESMASDLEAMRSLFAELQTALLTGTGQPDFGSAVALLVARMAAPDPDPEPVAETWEGDEEPESE